MLKGLVHSIKTIMKAQSCELFLADPQGRRLTLDTSTHDGIGEDVYNKFYSVDDENHLTSLVARNKRALAVPDTERWHIQRRVQAIVVIGDSETMYSFIGVPFLRTDDSVSGVIRCSNKMGYPRRQGEATAFHRHDIRVLEAIAESCSPLILAMTGERRISHRLVTAGHEVTAIAAVIQQKADRVMGNVKNLTRALEHPEKFGATCAGALIAISYGAKGIKDAGALVSIYQSDVSVSLSEEMVSWHPQPLNLYGDIIAQVVDMLREKAKSKGIEIDYGGLETAPKELWLDPSRTKQLFYNLLVNAIKYNRRRSKTIYHISGSESIEIERCKILIRSGWSEHRRSFFVAVVSDGRRIFEDEIDHIWEYGFRGRAARASSSGLGIGMYIAKKIERAASGMRLELTRLYEPIVFTVTFSYPILRGKDLSKDESPENSPY